MAKFHVGYQGIGGAVLSPLPVAVLRLLLDDGAFFLAQPEHIVDRRVQLRLQSHNLSRQPSYLSRLFAQQRLPIITILQRDIALERLQQLIAELFERQLPPLQQTLVQLPRRRAKIAHNAMRRFAPRIVALLRHRRQLSRQCADMISLVIGERWDGETLYKLID